MAGKPPQAVIYKSVQSVAFSFFSEDEIRRLSVKRISSPGSFDQLGQPVPGGLYDPAMGPTDRSATYV